jgi:hypothetical protein
MSLGRRPLGKQESAGKVLFLMVVYTDAQGFT